MSATAIVLAAAAVAACGGSADGDAAAGAVVDAQSSVPTGRMEATASPASTADAGAEADARTFATPRIAARYFGPLDTPDKIATAASFKLTVLRMPPNTDKAAVQAALAAIRVRNPGIQLAQYVNVNVLDTAAAAGSEPYLAMQSVAANNWWLRDANGKQVQRNVGSSGYEINGTAWAPPDASGLGWSHWKARADSSNYLARFSDLDFVFTDAVTAQPPMKADWKRIGSNQTPKDLEVQAAFRQGFVNYWSALRSQMPAIKVLANADNDLGSPEYKGKLEGAFLRCAIGQPASIETTGGWSAMMARYRAALANTTAQKAVVLEACETTADSARQRYGLTSALLEDGYFAYRVVGRDVPEVFDENSAPLGMAVDAPPMTPTATGIWMRRYENGLAIVNPTGNTATIDVGAGYKRIAGTRDPAVNNGQEEQLVTLGPKQGLVMLKVSSPQPPATTPVMSDLSFTGTSSAVTMPYIGATPTCAETFVPPDSLVKTAAAALPKSGGVFFSPRELDVWRARTGSGPFVNSNDFKTGSPGDWSRITANARTFVASGEPLLIVTNPDSKRATHGTLARDAAFHYLVTNDPNSLIAVRSHLLAQVANPLNDFTQLCFRALDRSARDAWYGEASWLLRHVVAYDYVRSALSAADRLSIENWIRRNAYFFAAQIDWGNALVFPKRLQGDYSSRASAAAAATDSTIYATTKVDSNGDCRVDGYDDPTNHPVYTYAREDGTAGPRITVLSQWFNNRKSLNAVAIGAAGLLLGDDELVNRSKRYTMEWLAYGVWADGSEGEFLRNGDYCIPQQGVIYAASNVQGALLMASLLARSGDFSLFNYRTTAGLFGTESKIGQMPKSIELVVSTRYKLITRQLPWYWHEAAKATQTPREQTHLGNMESYFMGTGGGTDNFHELGLLLGAKWITAVPIAGLVQRDLSVTSLRFPGSTGQATATGYGSWAGVWTDAFNALPSMFLLRP